MARLVADQLAYPAQKASNSAAVPGLHCLRGVDDLVLLIGGVQAYRRLDGDIAFTKERQKYLCLCGIAREMEIVDTIMPFLD